MMSIEFFVVFRVTDYVYHYRNRVDCGYSKRIVFIKECIPLMPGGEFISKERFLRRFADFEGTIHAELHLLSNLCNSCVICRAIISILS